MSWNTAAGLPPGRPTPASVGQFGRSNRAPRRYVPEEGDIRLCFGSLAHWVSSEAASAGAVEAALSHSRVGATYGWHLNLDSSGMVLGGIEEALG